MCACGRTSAGPDRYGPDYGARSSMLAKAPASMPWLNPPGYDPNCPNCRVGQTQADVAPAAQVALPYGYAAPYYNPAAAIAALLGPIPVGPSGVSATGRAYSPYPYVYPYGYPRY